MEDADNLTNCPQCGQDLSESQDMLLSGKPSFCQACRFPVVKVAGKYRLERELGVGGFATVYLAKHHRLTEDAERVIKFIKPEVISHPGVKQRFYREVQVTSTLSARNEHIVRIYDDFGEHEQLGHYYVMEYLQGQSLEEWSAQFPQGLPPLEDCLDVFGQLCDAMGSAHRADVIHRDLKPENIMLVSREKQANFLKVLDFGIAKPISAAERTSARLTQGLLGSPMYMAPEQCSNKAIDARADIYAMGCLLYLLLTGQTPFASLLDERGPMGVMQILQAHLMEPPPLAQGLAPTRVGAATEALLQSALAKDPDARPQSVDAFFDDLTYAMEQDGHFHRQDAGTQEPSSNVTAAYYTPVSKEPGVGGASPPLATPSSLESLAPQVVPVEPGGARGTAAFIRPAPTPDLETQPSASSLPESPEVSPSTAQAFSQDQVRAATAPTDPNAPFLLDKEAVASAQARAVETALRTAQRAAEDAAATVHDVGPASVAPVRRSTRRAPRRQRVWVWLLLAMLPLGVGLGIVGARMAKKPLAASGQLSTRLQPARPFTPRPLIPIQKATHPRTPKPRNATTTKPRRTRPKRRRRRARRVRHRARRRARVRAPRRRRSRRCKSSSEGTTWLALHTSLSLSQLRIEGPGAKLERPRPGLICIGLRRQVPVHFERKGYTPCVAILSHRHGTQRHFKVRLTRVAGIEFNDANYCFQPR